MNNFQNLNKITIKINPEYSNLVYPLSKLEYEQLKDSIRKDGLYLPIVINPKGEILDGHNRHKICHELQIPLKYEKKSFESLADEKGFVIDVNLKRRHLNDFQKAELAYKLEVVEREKAKQRQSEAGKLFGKGKKEDNNRLVRSNDHKLLKEKGRVIEAVSKELGISAKTYQRAKTIIENGPEEIKNSLRKGKTSISKEYEKIQRDKKRQELLSQINLLYNNSNNEKIEDKNTINNCKLLHGDFTLPLIQKEIPDNSVDLILTDPPYSQDSINLYQELATLATRALKSGGSIVTYVGHIILNEVIKVFEKYSLNNNSCLKYWWILGVKHSGHHAKIYPRHVFAQWKPMLWYIKGDKVNELTISNTFSDSIESKQPTKMLHKWEQSTIEAEYIVKNLTIENQTVFDPMMGSGTTAIAVLKLKRKFIGIEKDTNTFSIATARVQNFVDVYKSK